MIHSISRIKTVICFLYRVWSVWVLHIPCMPAYIEGQWTPKAIFPFHSLLFYCTHSLLISPLILSVTPMNETDVLNTVISNAISLFKHYQTIIHQYKQQYIKIRISVTVAVALNLYDLASRFAGDCLLGDEEEEGRRWVVEYPGVSEADPRRWSLLGEPDPEPPPPPDRGELTRWAGKVELE